MSGNGNVVDFPFAYSVNHPYIAKEIKAFCVPSATQSPCAVGGVGAATTVGTTPGAIPGDLNGVTIQVRSSEDDEKDLSAKIRQAKSNLSFIRGTWT